MANRRLHIIGFGGVGQAFYRVLQKVIPAGDLPQFKSVDYWYPAEDAASGNPADLPTGSLPITFNKIAMITRETLASTLDAMQLKEGDVVIEAATRIDTQTAWREVKARGAHFMNSGFDVWPDVTLDLAGLDDLQADPAYNVGKGPTCVFSFGCNPGIASHFVRHGLTVATGIEDTKVAAEAFGLTSISFFERDTQWPSPGTPGEALYNSTQLDVLYNTWSPGNYIVETAESTILYAGCPEAAKTISSAGPAVMGWVPSGPSIGFMAPHDETFTIQGWFNKPIPAVFVYEAPPSARAYLKGGRAQHSSEATCKLMTPKLYDLAAPGYDMLGALLYSDKPGVAPFWCGITQTVAGSAIMDPTGAVGPTPFQVVGGVWAALQYVLQHPDAGDNFPEGLPTPFIMANAFPWAGDLIARPAPEALKVTNLFNPGPTDRCWAEISVGEPSSERVTKDAAGVAIAAFAMPATAALVQLSYEIDVITSVPAAGFTHAATGVSNCFVDRNRAIRTLAAMPVGAPFTLDFRLLDPATVGTVPESDLAAVLGSVPILYDGAMRTALGRPLV